MTALKMNSPPIVAPQEWETARQQLLVKEKALTRARDALAAERRLPARSKVERHRGCRPDAAQTSRNRR